ncbi:MAG: hypothetical protein ACOYW7_12115 [Nitrospirota bacterium]
MRGERFTKLRVFLLFFLLGLMQLSVFLPSAHADALDVWHLRTSGTENIINDIKYINGEFVAVGANGTVLLSHDGKNWAPPESPLPEITPVPSFTRIAAGNGFVVVVGTGGTIVVASDGAVDFPSAGTTNDLYGVTYNPDNNTFVAVGAGGTIVTSFFDEWGNLTWNSQTWATGANLNRITKGNGLFVTVGDSGTILYSWDGTTWNSADSGTSSNIHRILYENGLFVAVGADGAITTSTDGCNWTAATSGTTEDLMGITYGNGIFVAVGNGGTIVTSPDGANWTLRPIDGITASLRVAFGNGTFVSVGDGGVILTSTDGVAWTQRNSGTDATLRSEVYALGTFVVAGSNGVILQSDPMAPQVKADIDYFYYWDDSGREIEYDFNEGALSGNSIPIPESAVWFRPDGDIAATYLWGTYFGNLGLNLDTANSVCTMTGDKGVAAAAFYADGAVAPASSDWSYYVMLKNFDVDLTLKQQYYSYSIGMDKVDLTGPRYRTGMEAAWFTGWYEGEEYNKALIVRAYIYDAVTDEDVWNEEYVVGDFPDPSKVSIELYMGNLENQLFAGFYYYDDFGNEGWGDFNSVDLSELLPEGATIPSFPNLYPYVALETGNLIGAAATSTHYGDAYYANPMVYDEGNAVSSAEVTGPGLEGTVSLIQNLWDDRVWMLEQHPNLGATPPDVPAVYHFIITLQDGTVIEYDRTISGYVQDFATNLRAVGDPSGQITFSWTGIANATGYSVELRDSSHTTIWNKYNLPSTTTNVVYDGWQTLNEGETYYLLVMSEIDSSGEGFPDISIAEEQFTYSAAVPSHIGTFRSGTWYLDNGNGVWNAGVDNVFRFGLATDIPVTGDWDGNGTKEIGVFRSGKWYLDMNGNGVWDPGVDAVYTFGMAGDIPVTGDWDGALDGSSATKIGVFRAGKWYLDMNGNGAWNPGIDAVYSFGLSTDIPVTGDWDGALDGSSATKIGVFRAGKWYLDNGNGVWNAGVDLVYTFGMTGDKPVTGDWDGNGSTEIGVFRNGTWYLDNGSGRWEAGTDLVFRFGLGTDTPVVK